MKSFLKANRRRIEEELEGSERWKYFSPAILYQYRVTLPMAKRFVRGQLIDLGCGRMPYRAALLPLVEDYDGLDPFPRSDQVRYTCSMTDMTEVPDASYDSAICLEVLEHVPDPAAALRETARILKPGGWLVLSVPHLSRLHDEPHDYFRYTSHGLCRLLESSGFEVVELQVKGGLFGFLSHQFSTLLLTTVWGVPLLRDLVYALNAWLVTRPAVFLDRHLDRGGLFALGYAAAARKR